MRRPNVNAPMAPVSRVDCRPSAKRKKTVTASIATAQKSPSSRTRPGLSRPAKARRVRNIDGGFGGALELLEARTLGVGARFHADAAAVGALALEGLHAG